MQYSVVSLSNFMAGFGSRIAVTLERHINIEPVVHRYATNLSQSSLEAEISEHWYEKKMLQQIYCLSNRIR